MSLPADAMLDPARTASAGFSLLESLLALVVLSIGLLGLLVLLTSALGDMTVARNENTATALVEDLAHAIRSNRGPLPEWELEAWRTRVGTALPDGNATVIRETLESIDRYDIAVHWRLREQLPRTLTLEVATGNR